jgi:hypothetical protein
LTQYAGGGCCWRKRNNSVIRLIFSWPWTIIEESVLMAGISLFLFQTVGMFYVCVFCQS